MPDTRPDCSNGLGTVAERIGLDLDTLSARMERAVAYKSNRFAERDMWIAATTLQAGLQEDEVKVWSKECFNQNFWHRVFPAMRSAIAELQRRHIAVWIVSASHRWIMEAAGEDLNVPATNVIAISTKTKNGLITDEVINPVPFQAGKVDAILSRFDSGPVIVFSDSINDEPMLSMATALAVTINPDMQLREIAKERRWQIQMLRAE